MKNVFQLVVAVVCLTLTVGCQQSASTTDKEAEHGHGHGHEHGHSDLPKTLNAAILEVRDLSDKFTTAMEKDDTEAAHDPLHNLGKILEAIPELAADTDLPEEEWDQVKRDAESLFEAFSEVDSAFHKKDGDKKAAFEKVKSAIEDGLKALETKLPALGGGEPHAEHDHDQTHDHSEDEHDHVVESHESHNHVHSEEEEPQDHE